jgi:septation ring formation regulator EzrA
MGFDVTEVKATLQRELNSLRQTAQELRVQAALARGDAKTECDRLESTLHRVHEDIQRMGEHVKTPLQDMETNARSLLKEVKQGFERLRRTLEA